MKIYMAQFESIVCKMEIVGEFEALQIMLLISKKKRHNRQIYNA
jgi:hypothetical protein